METNQQVIDEMTEVLETFRDYLRDAVDGHLYFRTENEGEITFKCLDLKTTTDDLERVEALQRKLR